jgi:hypothetical protein
MATLPPNSKGTVTLPQPQSVGFDPYRGATRHQTWKTLDLDQLNSLAAQAIALQLPYTLGSTGTVHTIDIEIPEGSTSPTAAVTPIDRWEMPPNEIQKSIWQHKKCLPFGADAAGVAQIQLDGGQTLAQCTAAMAAMTPDPSAAWDSDTRTAFGAAYNLASSGATHYALGQYVLRHTASTWANFAGNIADVNVEKLYTTDQLLIETADPTLWRLPIYPALIYRIRNLAKPPDRTGYLWSWRKLPSGIVATAAARIEYATEYWLEQWSTFLYDPVT